MCVMARNIPMNQDDIFIGERIVDELAAFFKVA